jgi:FAD-dependent oxidoreductase
VREGRKIKVMSVGSHTFNRFACPGGNAGVLINTRDYNSRIMVNKRFMTVTVDAGVQLKDLIKRLAAEGLTLPHSTYWDAVSMAGVVSTAAHGSGLWGKGSGVFEYVVAMSLVVPAPPYEGYAKLVRLRQKDQDLKAARISLGVLGAISRITFAVERMFKRSVVLEERRDLHFQYAVAPFARGHEFGDITWYPSLHQVVYRIDDRVPVSVPGEGKNLQILFRPQTVQVIVQSRQIEEQIQASKDVKKLCQISSTGLNQTMLAGGGFLNDGLKFTGYPVVGYNNYMQSSSGCQPDPTTDHNQKANICLANANHLKANDIICGWDSRVNGSFFFHTSIAIPLSSVARAIEDIKLLRDLNPKAFCGLDYYGGFLMRFIKKSEAYLGFNEDTVDIEFFYYRSRQPNAPRWNEDVMEEIEQLLLKKYGGRPHWAKNRVFTFDGAAQRAVSLEKFLEAKQRLDPFGFFSSEWSDAVLGTWKWARVQRWRDRCALDGLCVCKIDRHCSLQHGFLCRPGKVWTGARVCRQQ